MGTRYKDLLLVFCTICVSLGIGNGCEMEGVNNWHLWQNVEILDTFEGVVVRRSTSNILGIASISFSPNIGPYMEVSLVDSAFIIQTNERFKEYEEYETAMSINIATTFNCMGGSTRSLTFTVEIIDTNNNDPIFRPNDTYVFTVTPPLPPGYPITSFLNPLLVRDIDLTTQKIDFEVFDNSNFLINYDELSSTTPKEFRASLRTTTLIRSISEPIEFVISATDVDLTGDPRRTRNATVQIISDGSFELPDELIFTQSFYLADYTENNEITLREPISLQQGYHEEVKFSLITEEFSTYFEIVPNNNNVTLRVIKPIPVEMLSLRKLFLVIRADRQYTSGTSATVVLQLPEDVLLQFEQSVYEGAIIDNELQLSDLVLSQGYEDQTVSVEIQSELAPFFTYTINRNNITLSMLPLDETTIIQNTFLNLQIIASTSRSVTSTVVTLELIKNDKTTPLFEHTSYVGNYDPIEGLTIDKIVIIQGYDDTVEVMLAPSDHDQYFSVVPNGQYFELRASNLPPEIYSEGPLLLTIIATKPRTVGANAAISIILPSAIDLSFLKENYRGTIKENNLRIETFEINKYVNNMKLNLSGDYASYFEVTNEENKITLVMQDEIPDSVLLNNDFLLLSLSATAMNANDATTTILLEIIKEDTTTPVFNDKIYSVAYSLPSNLDVSRIFLTQGYDDTVSFRITGEHSEYFAIKPSGNEIELTVSKTIPEELIFKEKVLVFNIVAEKPLTVGARAAISVHFPFEMTEPTALAFSKTFYTGSLQDTVLTVEDIELSVGFTTDTLFTINEEYKNYFEVKPVANIVEITQINALPPETMNNKYIALELKAQRERAVSVSATIIIDIVQPKPVIPPVFSEPFYRAVYTEESGLQFEENITLSQGFDNTVIFELEGEYKDWFNVTNNDNSVLISVYNIPEDVLDTNQHLVFSVVARKIDANDVLNGRAAIVIDLPKESPELVLLRFTQSSYVGSIQNNILNLPTVTLAGIYDMAIELNTTGEYSSYFELTLESNVVNVKLINDIPSDIIDTIITINVEASYPGAISGFTTLVIELKKEPEIKILTPVFERAYYFGEYLDSDQLVFEKSIQLIQGFDETVLFELEGDDSNYFTLITISQNNFTLSIKNDSIDEINDRTHLLFSIIARNIGAVDGKAAVLITLPVRTKQVLGFERNYYVGSITGTTVDLAQIVLNEGFSSDVRFSLKGELSPFFNLHTDLATVTISLTNAIPEDSIPANGFIVIQVEAIAPNILPAYAPVILEVTVHKEDPPRAIAFEQTYYVGNFTTAEGLSFDGLISLAEGYDESVEFHLEGENAQWFALDRVESGARLVVRSPIPPAVLANNHQLMFIVRAERQSAIARATIVVLLPEDGQSNLVSFDRILYEGRIQGGIVQHEPIKITGYELDHLDLIGSFSALFDARHSQGIVVVETNGSLTLPDDLQHVVLELRADDAAAVLILDITGADPPVQAIVTFTSSTYDVRTTTCQTGPVGQVEATADNGERVSYSLLLNNDHLLSRLSISNSGEIRLSAPADSGNYEFQVIATTVFTGASGTATVYLSVDAQTSCEDKNAIPPLIVIDRDEEQPHRDLVTIDPILHKDCLYSLKNIWPADQSWLYVDETGLHAHTIDREDPSIAFMALSQVKVELTLNCNSNTRTKRSLVPKHDWLGPYDYGTNTWLLGNTIEYNPKKTIVNLVVNDINDNRPIFVGSDDGPIAVGYPVTELLSTVSPRYLIEVKATDADVGENAAIVYWSSESQISVSPSNGYVYVRNDAELTQDLQLVVSATDRNRQGLTGTIMLTVKLLNLNNIAILTVQDAFLEDEIRILNNISSAVGYEIKALKSVVESNTNEFRTDTRNRKQRDDTSSRGVSVQFYVYGLKEREVVAVDTLLDNMNQITDSVAVNIQRVVTLQEHLEGTCPVAGRNTALFVSTIVLSVLLFLLIVAAVVGYILFRIKSRNYEQFSDTNSLNSKRESAELQLGRPDLGGGGSLPRLNLEELKKSEKRLQDMLNAPVEKVIIEPTTSTNNSRSFNPLDTKVPIIIQDKLKDIDDSDDEDEFGERKKGRRKSVVTFNENVEKIIHVEDNPEEVNSRDESEFEVYKL